MFALHQVHMVVCRLVRRQGPVTWQAQVSWNKSYSEGPVAFIILFSVSPSCRNRDLKGNLCDKNLENFQGGTNVPAPHVTFTVPCVAV